jgi:menaquinol-cytochrome c reductase iron-sulfur subunit
VAVTRRQFAVGMTQLGGLAVAAMWGVPIIGWMLSPLIRDKEDVVWRQVGPVTNLEPESPTRFDVEFPSQVVWKVPTDYWIVYAVRYNDGSFKAFSNICTHMQCPVRWEPALGQFLCPCHGGLYDITGRNVGGPPPEPLPQWQHYIDRNGVLWVSNRLLEHMP